MIYKGKRNTANTGPPFVQPVGVPEGFALGVYAALHNQAQDAHWRAIQEAHAIGKALGWIKRIYKANKTRFTALERAWWLVQLEEE